MSIKKIAKPMESINMQETEGKKGENKEIEILRKLAYHYPHLHSKYLQYYRFLFYSGSVVPNCVKP